MKKQTLATTLFCLLFATAGRGQDAHFSQMLHTGSLLNPALTGAFERPAEYRAAVQYRQQWASLAPAYRDFMASLEKSGRVWQVGGLFYGHDAGSASLRTTGLRASAALQKPLGPGQNLLSLGLSLGLEQQRFDPAALTFSNQYDAEKGYVADQSNSETFQKTTQIRPDFAVGLGWRARFFSEKIIPAVGISLAHVAQPMFSAFQNGGYGLPTTFSWYARLGIRVDDQLTLTPFLWKLRQSGFKNSVVGADMAVKLPAATIHLAAGRRKGDAILLKIGLDRGMNTFGLSYDLNTSTLRRASSGQGGWELAVSHYFNRKITAADHDHDGVPDKSDDCPRVPAKTKCGCPPADNHDSDGDGIVDDKDKCPDEPGLIRLYGCPDTDGDGITDNQDQCPNLPGSLANNGCPLLAKDADDDGILDDDDHCPYIKGLARFHGCPDTDGDGVPDLSDKCPFLRGPAANEGCPITDDQPTDDPGQRISDARQRSPMPVALIEFDHDQADIKARFNTQLDRMASWLYDHPTARLMLAGHTDTEGNGAYNFQLGLRRAQVVEDYFVARRISPERIELISYGETIPKSENETAYGKARNRRTEVIVIEER